MNENGEFSYNGIQCKIDFFDKSFYLRVFRNGSNEKDRLIKLFPSNRYSLDKRIIAFDVANLLVLKNL